MTVAPDGLVARTFDFPPEIVVTMERLGSAFCCFWNHDGVHWRRRRETLPTGVERSLLETLLGLRRSHGCVAQLWCKRIQDQLSFLALPSGGLAEPGWRDPLLLLPQPDGALRRCVLEDARGRTMIDHLFLESCSCCGPFGQLCDHQQLLEDLRGFVRSRPLQSAEWPPMLVMS